MTVILSAINEIRVWNEKIFSKDLVPYTASGCTTLFSKTFGAVIKFEATGMSVKLTKGQGTCQRSVCITVHRQPHWAYRPGWCVPSVWLQMQGEHLAEPGARNSVLLFPAVSRFLIDYGWQRLRYGLIDYGSKRPVPKRTQIIIQRQTHFYRLHRMSSPVGWIDQSSSLPIVRIPPTYRRTPSSSTSTRRQSGRLIRRISIWPTKGKHLTFFALFCSSRCDCFLNFRFFFGGLSSTKVWPTFPVRFLYSHKLWHAI